MGRPKRSDEAGVIYHMLNRANRRAKIFHKDNDYEAFEQIMAEALERSPQLQHFAYCRITHDWHLMVRPSVDREMSRFGKWLEPKQYLTRGMPKKVCKLFPKDRYASVAHAHLQNKYKLSVTLGGAKDE